MTQTTDNAAPPNQTKFFFDLTPERILVAVERAGLRCTGRCLQLNSMENRVYEVEVEVPDESKIQSVYEKFRVVKFYRPGRWTREQILEEHKFLLDLEEGDIPAVAPLVFEDGSTLHTIPEIGIWYAVFPKVGGRVPDELSNEQLTRLGRLLARVHTVGASSDAPHRLTMNPETYGRANLEFLLSTQRIPKQLADRYVGLVTELCAESDKAFAGVPLQRIHGDCHWGNILWGREGVFFVDFDDMVRGPCVQDVWLICPGRDEEALKQREVFLAGYKEMRPFNSSTLRLVEHLRALRYIHFSAWIARRWEDPAFPKVFPQFGTEQYWVEQISDIREQLERIALGGDWQP